MKFYNRRLVSKNGVNRIEVTLDGLSKFHHGLVVWGEDDKGKVEVYFFDFHTKAFLNKTDFKAAKEARAAQNRIRYKPVRPTREGRLLRSSSQGWHSNERSYV